MKLYNLDNYSFTYPEAKESALRSLTFSIEAGQFVTLCGKPASGKSTLLRQLKTPFTPKGTREGEILFHGQNLTEVTEETQSKLIVYVPSHGEEQFVSETAFHELTFNLENLGVDKNAMELCAAELIHSFHMQDFIKSPLYELSVGQQHILKLASAIATQPEVLLLDEPLCSLDPIMTLTVIEALHKLNQEFGTTIVVAEQRLESLLSISHRVLLLEEGRLLLNDTPEAIGEQLGQRGHPMLFSMPAALQLDVALCREDFSVADSILLNKMKRSVSVRDGHRQISAILEGKTIKNTYVEDTKDRLKIPASEKRAPSISVTNLSCKETSGQSPLLSSLSFDVYPGEFFYILGQNGIGKSTLLGLLCGITPFAKGEIKIKEKTLKAQNKGEKNFSSLFLLPQNLFPFFTEATVEKELLSVLKGRKDSQGKESLPEEKQKMLNDMAELMEIKECLFAHPLELSAGEQRRVGLSKVLLPEPEVLLLDDPTCSLDNFFKEKLTGIIKKLLLKGSTVIATGNDLEFCAQYADRCGLLSGGQMVAISTPNKFFTGNIFYSTAATRMSRHVFHNAVNTRDVIRLCKQSMPK